MVLAAPEAHWLKITNGPQGYVRVKTLGGGLTVNGACVTSWDKDKRQADAALPDGRGFLLARDGGRMSIARSQVRYLGHGEVESYGLSWRWTAPAAITNSVVSHNYFGLYTFEVDDRVVPDNEVHDSVLYGIDPHTGSTNADRAQCGPRQR